MFSIKQLEIFALLSELHSVKDVATEFGMSASAISMSIKELEKILGMPLLERVGKKLHPNEKGRYLLEHSIKELNSLKTLYKNMHSSSDFASLHIASSYTITDYILPNIISKFINKYPNIDLNVKTLNSSDVLKKIKSGECDIGFIESECIDESIEQRLLVEDELIVVSSNKDLVKDDGLYIDQLFDQKWILREKGSGTRSVFLDTIKPYETELNIFMELEHNEAIKNFLINSKDFISALPKISVEQELKDNQLYVIKIKKFTFKREFNLVFLKNRIKSDVLESFSKLCLDTII